MSRGEGAGDPASGGVLRKAKKQYFSGESPASKKRFSLNFSRRTCALLFLDIESLRRAHPRQFGDKVESFMGAGRLATLSNYLIANCVVRCPLGHPVKDPVARAVHRLQSSYAEGPVLVTVTANLVLEHKSRDESASYSIWVRRRTSLLFPLSHSSSFSPTVRSKLRV